MAQSFEGLPARERAVRYRKIAAEISRQGCDSPFSELQPTFRNLALRWIALAEEVERGIDRQEASAGFDAAHLDEPGQN